MYSLCSVSSTYLTSIKKSKLKSLVQILHVTLNYVVVTQLGHWFFYTPSFTKDGTHQMVCLLCSRR